MASDDIVTRLREWFEQDSVTFLVHEAADEIERLRGERDEARRLYCEAVEDIERGLSNDSRRDVARARGWECYDNYTEEEVTDDGSAEF